MNRSERQSGSAQVLSGMLVAVEVIDSLLPMILKWYQSRRCGEFIHKLKWSAPNTMLPPR